MSHQERDDEKRTFERGDAGPTPEDVTSEPRGNQEPEQDEVDKGLDKLERITTH